MDARYVALLNAIVVVAVSLGIVCVCTYALYVQYTRVYMCMKCVSLLHLYY